MNCRDYATRSEHTFIPALLKPGGVAIDVGCRGFEFSNSMVNEFGMEVVTIDPDPQVVEAIPSSLRRFRHLQMALIAGEAAVARYEDYHGGEANRVNDRSTKFTWVEAINLSRLCATLEITEIELLKLDCEGSEYGILMNLPRTVGIKQISVEFHDFLGLNPYHPDCERYYKLLGERMQGYTFVKHDRTVRNGWNYWDSLIVRSDLVA